jgi:hypothetical protein
MAKKIDQVVKKLQAAWSEYQRHGVDKHGLDFGKKLFDLRAGSEVVQGGTTFGSSLDEAKIPRRTAYYWIHNYEISIGVREPDKPKVKQSEPDQTIKEPAQSAEPQPSCNIHGVPFKPTLRDIYWVPPANHPDIKGWSAMDAGEKHRAGQEAGCKYCLTYSSARSCPAHGWAEKRHDHESPLIPFEPQQEMALQIINDGFKARSAEEPEKQRLIQAAKTWAHARLSRTDLNPPDTLVKGMTVSFPVYIGDDETQHGMQFKIDALPDGDGDFFTHKGGMYKGRRFAKIIVEVIEPKKDPVVTTKPTVTKQLQQGAAKADEKAAVRKEYKAAKKRLGKAIKEFKPLVDEQSGATDYPATKPYIEYYEDGKVVATFEGEAFQAEYDRLEKEFNEATAAFTLIQEKAKALGLLRPRKKNEKRTAPTKKEEQPWAAGTSPETHTRRTHVNLSIPAQISSYKRKKEKEQHPAAKALAAVVDGTICETKE